MNHLEQFENSVGDENSQEIPKIENNAEIIFKNLAAKYFGLEMHANHSSGSEAITQELAEKAQNGDYFTPCAGLHESLYDYLRRVLATGEERVKFHTEEYARTGSKEHSAELKNETEENAELRSLINAIENGGSKK